MNQKNGDETQSLQRLKRVSGGIFMLAMTLMVLQFDLPNVEAEMSTIVSLINPTYWKWSFSLFFLCP